MNCVYIAEDDADIRELVSYALKEAGFAVESFDNADALLGAVKRRLPDVVLLDIMLPGMDGLDVLTLLKSDKRTKDVSVMMVTARGSEYDKVKGLNLGADDYVTKPFGVSELVARIHAVIRRNNRKTDDVITMEGVTLNAAKRVLTVDGEEIPLTYAEFELLHLLMINFGIVLSRGFSIDSVWGETRNSESRSVDMHIKSLRKKLGRYGGHIVTVRGAGYKYV